MRELGGETIMLTGAEMQLGRGETISDTAKVLSRYVDAIMIRMLDHNAVRELADAATVRSSTASQVVESLPDHGRHHDFEEKKGSIRGKTVAWAGDTKQRAGLWIQAAPRFGFKLNIAHPEELARRREIIALAQREGADVSWTSDPYQAVERADASSPTAGCRWATRMRAPPQPAQGLPGEQCS